MYPTTSNDNDDKNGDSSKMTLQAPILAVSHWINIMDTADPEWASTGAHPAATTFVLLPGFVRLHREGMLHTLICTIPPYLDTQEKWHAFAQHGNLHRYLGCLCASMQVVVKAFLEQSESQIQAHLEVGMEGYFEVLCQASEISSSHPEAFLTEFRDNAVLSSRGLGCFEPSRLMYSGSAKRRPHAFMGASCVLPCSSLQCKGQVPQVWTDSLFISLLLTSASSKSELQCM